MGQQGVAVGKAVWKQDVRLWPQGVAACSQLERIVWDPALMICTIVI
jgi:hypothetical protein